jgi:predicted dehydrogenase
MSSLPGRRDVLKAAALAGAGLASTAAPNTAPKLLHVGLVGAGGRGTDLLKELLKLEGVRISAVCDPVEERVARAQQRVTAAGQPKPEGYAQGDHDYRRLVERNDLDLVVNATPWEWHAPISLAALRAGKHVATEVPAALTVDECWELVETAEKTGRHCSMLENDCYDRETLIILNMLRAGVLGEALFAEAGYCHDLRTVQFNTVAHGEPWRLDHSVRRNGNLYPTHPIGPIAWWMDINRGDRFDFLVSMSSRSRAMHEFAVKQFGAADPRAKLNFAQGDTNTTLIRTAQGRTISLYFDTSTPRPKEEMMRFQCTKGCYSALEDKIFIEGLSNRNEGPEWLHDPKFEPFEPYAKRYEHELWKTRGGSAQGGAHGGIDYMELYRLVKCLQLGQPLDMDVYDAATWSVLSPLSEFSVANRNRSVDIPDFTRGKWKHRPAVDPEAIV